jgi:hypothetical protein
MANMRKFSDMKDIGHLCAHYERSVQNDNYGNPDIDKSKLPLDHINLAPDRGKQTDYIKAKIEKIMDGRTLRKDAVKMCCWIVDAPEQLPEEKKNVFFQATYKFLVDRYGKKSGMGEDVVISAYIHKSETTDHIHFAFLPVVEKRLCAKECVGRADLQSFHKDYASYMEQLGICKKSDILNGKTKRDANGRALSVKELKRQRYLERERKVEKRKLNLRMHNTEKERSTEKVDRWDNSADRTEKKINLRRDRW